MKPALYNTTTWTPEQRELSEKVYAWLQTVAMKPMAYIGTKFGTNANGIRAVVELLMHQGRITSKSDTRNRLFGIDTSKPDEPLVAARTWKPLKPDPRLLERLAEIRAQREAFPSKHI